MQKTVAAAREVALSLGQAAMSERMLGAFASAGPFLDVAGDTVLGWMHLWRATAAAPRLEKICGSLDAAVRREKAATNKHAAFYEGQVKTAEYFIGTVLPATRGRMDAVARADTAAVDMPEAAFGG